MAVADDIAERQLDPVAGVVEQPLPRRAFAPIRGMPRELHRAEHAFRVGHHDRHAAVLIAQSPRCRAASHSDSRDTSPSADRHGRNEAHGGRARVAARRAPRRMRSGAAFAVRSHDRKPGSAIPRSSTDGLSHDLDEHEACFELIGPIAQELGHAAVPGISDFSAASIWQPLHTPSANASSRAKNSANSLRAALVDRESSSPSPRPLRARPRTRSRRTR